MPRALPNDPMLRRLIELARAQQLSRRRLLQVGAAGAGALTLAACAPAGGGGGGGEGGLIRWANWTGYMDEDDAGNYPTLDAFQERTGIPVEYLVDVDDNNTFYATIQGQLELNADTGYDTFCLTDWMAARLIRDGQVQSFDYANLPNVSAQLNPSYKEAAFDPGRAKSIPWQGGYAGLVYDEQAVPGGIKSVEDLWKPEFRGRVVVLSELRDTVGVVMQSLGTDISTNWGADAFYNALDVVGEQIANGQIGAVKGNSYTDDLINGDAVVGIVWSGDVESILNAELAAAGEDPRFQFVLPDSGGTLWADNFLVPNASTAKKEVEQLIDYYYEPEVAAELAAWVNFVSPCVGAQAAMEQFAPELVDNWLIFPNDEVMANVRVFRGLSEAEENEYSAAWQALNVGV